MVDIISVVTGYAGKFVTSITEHLFSISSTEAIIFDIAIILIISAILAFVARVLRQPLIPAYVIAGLLIGPLVFGLVKNIELVYAFSEIGIAFLLFTAGLEISFNKIKQANLKKIILIGTLQVLAVFFITIALGKFLNLSLIEEIYIGIILAFSSTMVDVKLLSDMGELVTMHGRIVLGVLLLQDLFAIIAIIILTSGGFALIPVSIALLKLSGIILFALILGKWIIKPLFRYAAKSIELLFLLGLALLFLFVGIAYAADISIIIGAFIAGIIIANSPFKTELESRMSSLRDFFAIIFFVALGMQIVFTGLGNYLILLAFLIIGAILIKPLIIVILLRITGYRPKTSFLTSISLAQLSEFSLIIGMIGVSLGALSKEIFSLIILATIITMAITTYFIEYKEWIYILFRYPMRLLKFLPIKENLEYCDKQKKTIALAGGHRMGSIILKELLDSGHKKEIVVIDYNPEIISALIKKKISCIYGDLGSPEIFDHIDTENLELVISTVPNQADNLSLLKITKQRNKHTRVILTAGNIDNALKLYEHGADYIILPKVTAGAEVASIIHDGKKKLSSLKSEHIKKLKEIHNILY